MRLLASKLRYLRWAHAFLDRVQHVQLSAAPRLPEWRAFLDGAARAAAARRQKLERPPRGGVYASRCRRAHEPEEGLTPDQLFMRRRLSSRDSFKSRRRPLAAAETGHGGDTVSLQRVGGSSGSGPPAGRGGPARPGNAPAAGERAVIEYSAIVE